MLQSCEFFTIDEWHRPTLVCIRMNEDSSYEDIEKEFAKNGIFHAGCKAVAPASIIFEDAPEDCIVIGTEDDGTIYFSSSDIMSVAWVPDFIKVLTKISDFVNV